MLSSRVEGNLTLVVPFVTKPDVMRKIFLSGTSLLFSLFSLFGQTTTSLSPVAASLFQNVKSKLNIEEKNFIAKKLGFILSGKKDLPFALDKDSRDYPFGVSVMPTDMNKDGKEEIFITYGNSYTSGNAGSSVVLFIKNSSAVYEMNLGFPGMTPDVLTTISKGYPDLLVGGPGFEFPVLRWNGKLYDNYKSVKDSEYEKLKKTSADQLSKQYQETVSQ